MNSEKLIREAEIARLKNQKDSLNIQILSLVTDLRQKISPSSTSNLENINIEEAEVIFIRLKECVLKLRQINKDIEFKENL